MPRARVIVRCLAAAMTGMAILISASCSGPSKTGQKNREEALARVNAGKADLAAQQASQNFEVGNLDDALKAADVAISLQPENAQHYVMRGRILIELHRLDYARQALEKAIELAPEHADAHYYLGLVFQRWSDNDLALENYQAAFALDGTNSSYMLATLETLITMRETEAAENLIDENLAQFEHNAAMRRAQGHLYLLKGDAAKAVESFNRAMLLAPDDPAVVEDLAHALFKAGDYARAEYYLDRLLKDTERAERLDLRHMKARCLVAQGRLIDARFIYLDLTKQFASERVLWYELGMVAIQLGDSRRSQQVAARMISTWPTRHEGYLVRGLLALETDDRDAAQRDLLQALSLAPEDGDTRLMLSMALVRAGMPDVARTTLARTLEADPDNQRAQRMLSSLTSEVASAEADPN